MEAKRVLTRTDVILRNALKINRDEGHSRETAAPGKENIISSRSIHLINYRKTSNKCRVSNKRRFSIKRRGYLSQMY